MKIEKKGWNIKVLFEPYDWNRDDGKDARTVMAEIKKIGGKYYGTDKSWNLKSCPETQMLLDWLEHSKENENRVDLTGTEHLGARFVKQFEDLP